MFLSQAPTSLNAAGMCGSQFLLRYGLNRHGPMSYQQYDMIRRVLCIRPVRRLMPYAHVSPECMMEPMSKRRWRQNSAQKPVSM
jgi:hypothetical protein